MGLKALSLTVLIAMGMLCTTAFAQTGQSVKLHLSNGYVYPEENSLQKFSENKQSFQKALFDNNFYCLTRAENVKSITSVIDGIEHIAAYSTGHRSSNDIEHLIYLGNKTWISRIAETENAASLRRNGISAIAILPPELKLSPTLEFRSYDDEIRVALILPKQRLNTAMLDAVKATGAKNMDTRFKENGILIADIQASLLLTVAELPFIAFIESWENKTTPLNRNHPASTRGSALVASGFAGARGLTGKDIVIGMGDGGEVPMSGPGYHIDRNPMIFNEAEGTAPGWGVHADHIAGSIAGLGNLDMKNKGLATSAALVTEKSSQIIFRLDTLKSAYGITLINGSFGPAASDCTNYGDYTALSSIIDQQAFSYPDLLHVFAAGNSGQETCGAYSQGFKTVLREFAPAKNSLTVGVVKNKRRTIEALSSRGPVTDGRLKPEITASGVNVTSTTPGNQYSNITGTSMAAAAVTGNLALISEQYRTLNNGESPDGGLLKAVVCNTAADRGNPGPDYIYGFGVINSRRAIETIEETRYFSGSLSSGQNAQHVINIPANAYEVRVLLYWVDVEGSPLSSSALVNDLDLTVSQGTESYQPWILNPEPGFTNDNAVRGEDHINNIEQVTFQPAGSGNYTIEISAFDVPIGPQKYYVVYEIIEPSIVLTHPFGGDVFNFNVTEEIRWDAFGPGAEQVTIEFSIDGGHNWTEIPAFDNQSDAEEFTRWYIPGVNTSKALVKVSLDGTDIYDVSNDFITLTGVPQNFQATDNCQNNIRLTWDPIDGVSQYEIMVLDTTMKTLLSTYNTTALIPDLIPGQGYWFSVRAKLEDGSTGRRTPAIYAIASSGSCLPLFDASADVITGIKETGREFTSTSFTANEIVTVEVSNLGNTVISNIPVSYSVNSGPAISEIYSGTLQPGESGSHIFSTTIDLSLPGNYMIDAWTDLENDFDVSNDNVSKPLIARQIANPPLQFPIAPETFEQAEETVLNLDKLGFGGLDNCDFNTDSETGRLRTNAGTGFTNGNRAATLDASFEQTRTVNELILTYNLSNQDPGQMMLNFEFMHHGQENDDANTVFIRGSDSDDWIPVFDLDANQGVPGVYVTPPAPIELISHLSANGHSLTSSFQVRFCQAGEVNANNQYENDGYTFDNIELTTVALPIELSGFEAVLNTKNDAVLTWETQTEINNYGFEIQVAEGDEALIRNEFLKIGFIEGAGTSTSPKSYTFLEKDIVKSGVRYYRLRQVDFDGSFSYSPVRSVTVGNLTAVDVSVFPNPVAYSLNIKFEAGAGQTAGFRITDSTGRPVLAYEREIQFEGIQKETINLDGILTTGVFFLHTRIGENSTVTRFLKTCSF